MNVLDELKKNKLQQLIDAALRKGSKSFDASAYDGAVVQEIAESYRNRGWDVSLNESNQLQFVERQKRQILKG